MKEKWDFTSSIEEMSPEQVKARITAAMEYKNEFDIKTIPYAGRVSQTVTYDFHELVARCPMTGYLDFYSVRIIFIPGMLLPELKSLKLYYFGFADLPISHEHLAARIFTEFCEAVQPLACRLKLIAGIRGGIKTSIVVGEKDI